MGEIVLVRHGQANSHAEDAESYDALSDLGRQQARWLGAWFDETGQRFDRVISGQLTRQRDTAAELGFSEAEVDPRLDEMDYFSLAEAMRARFDVPIPGFKEFPSHIPRVLEAWHQDEIRSHETFAEFESRVGSILAEAAAPGVHVLAVTSGGVIGMCLRRMLGLSPRRMAEVILPTMNSSVHRINIRPHGTYLAGFNAVPHLDRPDRVHAKTWV